jgi:hypothetical protein
MDGNMNVGGGKCDCSHHKVTPILVVLFGVVFLLGNLSVLSAEFVNIAWPIIVGVYGLMKLFGGSCKCC